MCGVKIARSLIASIDGSSVNTRRCPRPDGCEEDKAKALERGRGEVNLSQVDQ